MKKELAIKLTHITKKYVLHHDKPTLIESIIHRKNEVFFALKNINLEIEMGERVGIIGPNGSGKTTLLKVIAGITTPTSGTVMVKGKIISLIDLEAGFHPDLTGMQNIFLNGTIVGMKKKEISKNLNKIIQFADIKQFIDAPLFTYSEGMKLRLGFSIAINASPDILILDENFSVGDEDFKNKAQKEISKLTNKNKTVIITSHWVEFLKKNCDRILTMENGRFTQRPKKKSNLFYSNIKVKKIK